MSFDQIFILIFVIFLAGFSYASFKGAPWVPTRKKDLEFILENIKIPNEAVVYDFGSGDGRAIFQFAKNINVRKAIGFELAWPLVLYSEVKKIFLNKAIAEKISFKFANFLTAEVKDADVIFCFLLPETIKKIFPDVFKKMKSGSLFISAVFPFNDLLPVKILRRSEKDCAYYVYEK